MIQGHGNDWYKYGAKIKFDFSSNIAFNNHSKKIVEFLGGRLRDIENYPDPTAYTLSGKIAKHHQIGIDSVVVCNGSTEGFYMIAHWIARRAKGSTKSLIFTPSFAEYEDSCSLYDHSIEFTSLNDFASIDYSPFDSAWLGTPNNPDGQRISINEIEAMAKANPGCKFIVDRAYNDLSASMDSEMAIAANNIIFVHSLTKSFGIPGVRLGYITAPAENCEEIKKLQSPWSVNALSLCAGEFVMDNYQTLKVDLDELLCESQKLQNCLSKIGYLEVTTSDSNFFLCQITDGRKAEKLHQYLIEKHGILIRNASNFRGLTPYHFRIATQRSEANEKLIVALKQWI
ncbi:MAG: aminotransferase class I/II-fold pyridoxal phosphate-dependent enzyme [Rikenellaceae bacterium]